MRDCRPRPVSMRLWVPAPSLACCWLLVDVPRLGPLPRPVGLPADRRLDLLLFAGRAQRAGDGFSRRCTGFAWPPGSEPQHAFCLMLDLTLPDAAGTFIGVLGIGPGLLAGHGQIAGGGLLDRPVPLHPSRGPSALRWCSALSPDATGRCWCLQAEPARRFKAGQPPQPFAVLSLRARMTAVIRCFPGPGGVAPIPFLIDQVA